MKKPLLFAAFLIVFLQAPCRAAPLKVGFIGALTGPGKVFGDAARNGLTLGLEDEGNVLDIHFEDDQFVPSQTVSAYRKLARQEKLPVVLVIGSTPANAIAPLAERDQTLLLACASDSRIDKGRSWVIRVWPSGEEEGSLIAKEAKKRKLSKVAWLGYTDDYSSAVGNSFKREFSGNIGPSDEVPGAELNFEPFLLKAKNSKVEALGICLKTGQVALFARQARGLGLTQPFFGCITLDNAAEAKNSGGALSPGWFVTVAVEEAFRKRYRERFGNEDALSLAAVYHDLVKILAPLSESQKSELPKKLLSAPPQTSALGTASFKRKRGQQYLSTRLEVRELGTL